MPKNSRCTCYFISWLPSVLIYRYDLWNHTITTFNSLNTSWHQFFYFIKFSFHTSRRGKFVDNGPNNVIWCHKSFEFVDQLDNNEIYKTGVQWILLKLDLTSLSPLIYITRSRRHQNFQSLNWVLKRNVHRKVGDWRGQVGSEGHEHYRK